MAGLKPSSVVLSGSLNAPGQSASVEVSGTFNVTVGGPFTGTGALERSFDNGSTFIPVASTGVTADSITTPVSRTYHEPERGVLYRFNFSALSAGAAAYRISQ